MISDKVLEEAIKNCDRAPIQSPGTIQPFGALLALDAGFRRVEFASLTAETFLGVKAQDLLGQDIEKLLDSETCHRARNCLSHRTIQKQRELIGEKEFAGKRLQMSIHLKDNRSVIEFLPVHSNRTNEAVVLEKTRALLAESVAVSDFQTTLESAVDSLRASTEFDRVKAYRFLPDGSGEVVAESRAAHVDSFLGLRFPASDIPPIARKLYSSTPIRVISDVDAADAAVIGSPSEVRPLDLSLAVLRGTADVHIQYIRNMGVKSTLLLPIVVAGELWGLFSMHHMKPRTLDPNMLIGAELSGKVLSLIIQHTAQTRHQSHLNSCAGIASELIDAGEFQPENSTYWEKQGKRLSDAIPSQGVAFIFDDQIFCSGRTPDSESCLAIRELGSKEAGEKNLDLQSFDDLQQRLSPEQLGNTGGALVMYLSKDRENCLILLRDLALQQVNWAGAPNKELRQGKHGPELTPRNSFSSYVETVREKSDEWSNDNMEVAAVLQNAIVRALDIEIERKDSRKRLQLMIRELNHRVRNILTLVQSLSSSSKMSATSIESYATALEQRIVALAGAHDLLTHEDMRGIRLDKIASLELQPYLKQGDNSSLLRGPNVVLNADVSPIVALVLHELTSNAVKYGSLSQPSGTVSLEWSVSDAGLEIEWLEEGGPVVHEPTHEGFGRSIIESAIPHEFGGTAQIRFESSGVRVNLCLPAGEFEADDAPVSSEAPSESPYYAPEKNTKEIARGLIVEDNFVIASQAKRWLTELGFEQVDTVATVKAALALLANESVDFCLLDVNLRGVISEPIAKRLSELGTPYVFASGYGSEGVELCDQFDVPFLTKPINIDQLRDVLKELGVGEW